MTTTYTQRTIDLAEEIPNYTGWVYAEFDDQESYFEDVDCLIEHWHDQDGKWKEKNPLPEFVFCCDQEGFVGLDLSQILAEWYDDDAGAPDLNGVEKLQAAVDEFNTENVHYISYAANYDTKVRVQHEIK